jgi:hypothetical protein
MAAPADPDCVYVMDTSSWIAISDHPAQNRIQSRLVELIEAGRIKFPPQVFEEFTKVSDLVGW